VHLITGHEDPEGEQRYISTLSVTSALDGVCGRRHASAVLPPGVTRYPLYRRLSGPQFRSGPFGDETDPLLLAGIEPAFWGCPDKTQVTMQTTTSGCRMFKLVLGETASREWRGKTVASQYGGVRVMAVQALRGGA
jgi:hypothetical protein